MILIKSLYPNLPMTFDKDDLSKVGQAGNYCAKSDTITISSHLLPMCRKIVQIHEIMHATGISSRTMRRARLLSAFKSKAYHAEECIAEIATMIVMRKLGMFNQYSVHIPIMGLQQYYIKDMYIPWREVVSAVNHFKGDDVDFHVATDFVKRYCETVLKLEIKDTYDTSSNKAASQQSRQWY